MDINDREIEWYKQHGNYPQRITKDKFNRPYVIGDWSWNNNGRPSEWIEERMRKDNVYLDIFDIFKKIVKGNTHEM
jgi:hypothetical protein